MVGKRQGKRKQKDIQLEEDQVPTRHNPKRRVTTTTKKDETVHLPRVEETNTSFEDHDAETQPPTLDSDCLHHSTQEETTENSLTENSIEEIKNGNPEKEIPRYSVEIDHAVTDLSSHDNRSRNDTPFTVEEDNSLRVLEPRPDENTFIADLMQQSETAAVGNAASMLLDKCKLDSVGECCVNDQNLISVVHYDVVKGDINCFKRSDQGASNDKILSIDTQITVSQSNDNADDVSESLINDFKLTMCSQSFRKKFQPPLKKDGANNSLNSSLSTDTSSFICQKETRNETSGESSECEKVVEKDKPGCGTSSSIVQKEMSQINLFETTLENGNESQLTEQKNIADEDNQKPSDDNLQQPNIENTSTFQRVVSMAVGEDTGVTSFSSINKEVENDVGRQTDDHENSVITITEAEQVDVFTEKEISSCTTDVSSDDLASVLAQQQNDNVPMQPLSTTQMTVKTLVFSQESRFEDSISEEKDDFNGCTQKFDITFVNTSSPQSNLQSFEQNEDHHDTEANLKSVVPAPFSEVEKPHVVQSDTLADTSQMIPNLTESRISKTLVDNLTEKIHDYSDLSIVDHKIDCTVKFVHAKSNSEKKELEVLKGRYTDVPKNSDKENCLQQKVPDQSILIKDGNENVNDSKLSADDDWNMGLNDLEEKSKYAEKDSFSFDIFHTPEKATNPEISLKMESFWKKTPEIEKEKIVVSAAPVPQKLDSKFHRSEDFKTHQGKDPNLTLEVLESAGYVPKCDSLKQPVKKNDPNHPVDSISCSPKSDKLKSKELSSCREISPVPDVPGNLSCHEDTVGQCFSSKCKQISDSPWDGVSDAMMMMLTDSQIYGTSSEQEIGKVISERQAESARHVSMKREEGRNLTQIVLKELTSINKQLLRLKREMDSFKRNMSSCNGAHNSNSAPIRQQSVTTMFKQLKN